MKSEDHGLSLEAVLDAYVIEPVHDADTLKKYLQEYPRFAADLVDLSREISREPIPDSEPPSDSENAFIQSAWSRFVEAATRPVADPLASLSVVELKRLAEHLRVPRQVIAAFREHRIIVESIPRAFLAKFAAELQIATDVLGQLLATPAKLEEARQYKAERKPTAPELIEFRQLLVDASLSPEAVEELMSDPE